MSTESRQEKDRAEQLVMERVARAYLTALRAQANVDASKANVTLAEALVKLAQSQKNAGTGTGIEVTRAAVQVANEQQHLVAAENDYQLAALGLLREMGAGLDVNLKLTDSMNYKAIAPEPVETAIQQAMKARADFLAQQTRESAAKANYDSVKWERLPSLGISGDYGTIGPGFSNAIPTWKAQATLRVPIYDGGRRDARRAEAASALRSEQIRSRDLKQQVELELRTSLKELQSAEAQMKAAQEGLELSNNELAQARRRYEAGITNSVEVTDAQTRLARARDNYTIALYGHNVARLDLQSAMGSIGQLVQ
jgi:outer membrane protein